MENYFQKRVGILYKTKYWPKTALRVGSRQVQRVDWFIQSKCSTNRAHHWSHHFQKQISTQLEKHLCENNISGWFRRWISSWRKVRGVDLLSAKIFHTGWFWQNDFKSETETCNDQKVECHCSCSLGYAGKNCSVCKYNITWNNSFLLRWANNLNFSRAYAKIWNTV